MATRDCDIDGGESHGKAGDTPGNTAPSCGSVADTTSGSANAKGECNKARPQFSGNTAGHGDSRNKCNGALQSSDSPAGRITLQTSASEAGPMQLRRLVPPISSRAKMTTRDCNSDGGESHGKTGDTPGNTAPSCGSVADTTSGSANAKGECNKARPQFSGNTAGHGDSRNKCNGALQSSDSPAGRITLQTSASEAGPMQLRRLVPPISSRAKMTTRDCNSDGGESHGKTGDTPGNTAPSCGSVADTTSGSANAKGECNKARPQFSGNTAGHGDSRNKCNGALQSSDSPAGRITLQTSASEAGPMQLRRLVPPISSRAKMTTRDCNSDGGESHGKTGDTPGNTAPSCGSVADTTSGSANAKGECNKARPQFSGNTAGHGDSRNKCNGALQSSDSPAGRITLQTSASEAGPMQLRRLVPPISSRAKMTTRDCNSDGGESHGKTGDTPGNTAPSCGSVADTTSGSANAKGECNKARPQFSGNTAGHGDSRNKCNGALQSSDSPAGRITLQTSASEAGPMQLRRLVPPISSRAKMTTRDCNSDGGESHGKTGDTPGNTAPSCGSVADTTSGSANAKGECNKARPQFSGNTAGHGDSRNKCNGALQSSDSPAGRITLQTSASEAGPMQLRRLVPPISSRAKMTTRDCNSDGGESHGKTGDTPGNTAPSCGSVADTTSGSANAKGECNKARPQFSGNTAGHGDSRNKCNGALQSSDSPAGRITLQTSASEAGPMQLRRLVPPISSRAKMTTRDCNSDGGESHGKTGDTPGNTAPSCGSVADTTSGSANAKGECNKARPQFSGNTAGHGDSRNKCNGALQSSDSPAGRITLQTSASEAGPMQLRRLVPPISSRAKMTTRDCNSDGGESHGKTGDTPGNTAPSCGSVADTTSGSANAKGECNKARPQFSGNTAGHGDSRNKCNGALQSSDSPAGRITLQTSASEAGPMQLRRLVPPISSRAKMTTRDCNSDGGESHGKTGDTPGNTAPSCGSVADTTSGSANAKGECNKARPQFSGNTAGHGDSRNKCNGALQSSDSPAGRITLQTSASEAGPMQLRRLVPPISSRAKMTTRDCNSDGGESHGKTGDTPGNTAPSCGSVADTTSGSANAKGECNKARPQFSGNTAGHGDSRNKCNGALQSSDSPAGRITLQTSASEAGPMQLRRLVPPISSRAKMTTRDCNSDGGESHGKTGDTPGNTAPSCGSVADTTSGSANAKGECNKARPQFSGNTAGHGDSRNKCNGALQSSDSPAGRITLQTSASEAGPMQLRRLVPPISSRAKMTTRDCNSDGGESHGKTGDTPGNTAPSCGSVADTTSGSANAKGECNKARPQFSGNTAGHGDSRNKCNGALQSSDSPAGRITLQTSASEAGPMQLRRLVPPISSRAKMTTRDCNSDGGESHGKTGDTPGNTAPSCGSVADTTSGSANAKGECNKARPQFSGNTAGHGDSRNKCNGALQSSDSPAGRITLQTSASEAGPMQLRRLVPPISSRAKMTTRDCNSDGGESHGKTGDTPGNTAPSCGSVADTTSGSANAKGECNKARPQFSGNTAGHGDSRNKCNGALQSSDSPAGRITLQTSASEAGPMQLRRLVPPISSRAKMTTRDCNSDGGESHGKTGDTPGNTAPSCGSVADTTSGSANAKGECNKARPQFSGNTAGHGDSRNKCNGALQSSDSPAGRITLQTSASEAGPMQLRRLVPPILSREKMATRDCNSDGGESHGKSGDTPGNTAPSCGSVADTTSGSANAKGECNKARPQFSGNTAGHGDSRNKCNGALQSSDSPAGRITLQTSASEAGPMQLRRLVPPISSRAKMTTRDCNSDGGESHGKTGDTPGNTAPSCGSVADTTSGSANAKGECNKARPQFSGNTAGHGDSRNKCNGALQSSDSPAGRITLQTSASEAGPMQLRRLVPPISSRAKMTTRDCNSDGGESHGKTGDTPGNTAPSCGSVADTTSGSANAKGECNKARPQFSGNTAGHGDSRNKCNGALQSSDSPAGRITLQTSASEAGPMQLRRLVPPISSRAKMTTRDCNSDGGESHGKTGDTPGNTAPSCGSVADTTSGSANAKGECNKARPQFSGNTAGHGDSRNKCNGALQSSDSPAGRITLQTSASEAGPMQLRRLVPPISSRAKMTTRDCNSDGGESHGKTGDTPGNTAPSCGSVADTTSGSANAKGECNKARPQFSGNTAGHGDSRNKCNGALQSSDSPAGRITLQTSASEAGPMQLRRLVPPISSRAKMTTRDCNSDGGESHGKTGDTPGNTAPSCGSVADTTSGSANAKGECNKARPQFSGNTAGHGDSRNKCNGALQSSDSPAGRITLQTSASEAGPMQLRRLVPPILSRAKMTTRDCNSDGGESHGKTGDTPGNTAPSCGSVADTTSGSANAKGECNKARPQFSGNTAGHGDSRNKCNGALQSSDSPAGRITLQTSASEAGPMQLRRLVPPISSRAKMDYQGLQ
ncbi:filaggrin-2-like [Dermacentor silvarum]|uniref:filaggrin-2-like n=1 Tax=Dermacentor silvarum TaxID=543639 RepID=UPI0018998E87|nr:filaggrin-2-like [Dermacentor silvarum]